jgi:hypothetical protein
MLLAATGFAAKKEKDLICHVGNEVGPNGEVYLDDRGCIPTEENGYFCPDAGKIDLIEVSKVAKHLNNPSHAYDGVADYFPEDIGASGVGNEDSEGDGVDDGCRPPPPPASCPCWTSEVLNSVDGINSIGDEIGIYTESNPPFAYCEEWEQPDGVYLNNYVFYRFEENLGDPFEVCQSGGSANPSGSGISLRYYGEDDPRNTLTLEESIACSAEALACVSKFTP